MKKYLWLFLAVFFCSTSLHAEEVALQLDSAQINLEDINSVKRGAKFFASVCMACHTAVYLRYNKLAEESGVLYDKMPVNVKSWPNGITPPDLSLEVDARGADWVYTYLHSFYVDTSRPSGVNNLLVPNTAMPGIIMAFQGPQLYSGNLPSLSMLGNQLEWFDLLTLQKQGTMTSEQFDQTMRDVVDFLAYAAEPFHEQQVKLGRWIIGFLIILFVFMYLLKKSYWHMLKNKRKK